MTPTITRWDGCYRDGWQDLIVPEAFAHPAKYSRGLIHRIYRHLLEREYVRPGQTICDPFAGVGLGALDAMTYGLSWIGCELEPRFVDLAQQNLELWHRRYGFTGGTVVQGDSRQLRQVLEGVQATCVVGSPPFLETEGGCRGPRQGWSTKAFGQSLAQPYGHTEGQLGSLPPGTAPAAPGTPPSALVSSPPYAGAGQVLGTHNGIDYSKVQGSGKAATPARVASGESYGRTPGQFGNMAVGRLDLASYNYHDRINHIVLSGNKDDVCPSVKTAAQPFQEEAGGVSPVAENMSVQPLRAVQNPQGMAQKLPLRATTNLLQNAGETPIRIGQEEMTVGEGTPGVFSDEPLLNAMAMSAPYAEQPQTSRSITSVTIQKPMASGIIASITSKPSADPAMPKSPSAGVHEKSPAVSAVGSSLLNAHGAPSALHSVGERQGMKQEGNTTSPMPKPSRVAPVESRSVGQDNATSFARQNASRQDATPLADSPADNDPTLNTFWGSADAVMREVSTLLPVGAVACWVVKGYVSKGRLVNFPGQWLALCERHGFTLLEEIHASLIESCGTQEGLFGEAETVEVARKSFFRRLAERKGSPRIDHETVLILRKEA